MAKKDIKKGKIIRWEDRVTFDVCCVSCGKLIPKGTKYHSLARTIEYEDKDGAMIPILMEQLMAFHVKCSPFKNRGVAK